MTSPIRVVICMAMCSRCGMYFEFPMVFASFYDFGTYHGLSTGTLYRVDLDALHYTNVSLEDALAPAIETEGGMDKLLEPPQRLFCPHCKQVVLPFREIQRLREEVIEGVVLPAPVAVEAVTASARFHAGLTRFLRFVWPRRR